MAIVVRVIPSASRGPEKKKLKKKKLIFFKSLGGSVLGCDLVNISNSKLINLFD